MLEEFRDKPFVYREIKQLLKRKFKTLTEGALTVHYIPVKGLTTTKMQLYLQRAVHVHTVLDIKKPLVFWIIPTSVPRLFPGPGEAVSEKHINGGYTYLSGNNIYIYRYEDLPKVMLHEVIHHSKLNTNTAYNEAIVEFWTVIFHLLAVNKELFEEELQWSLYLCKRLETHTGDVSYAYNYIYIKTCLLFFKDTFIRTADPVTFINKHKNNKRFKKAIQEASDFNTNSFRIVLHGND